MREYENLEQIGKYQEYFIDDIFLSVKYDEECVKKIYEDIKKCKGYDNKAVYKITTKNNENVYVMYYDNYIYFGLSVKKGEFYRLYN